MEVQATKEVIPGHKIGCCLNGNGFPLRWWTKGTASAVPHSALALVRALESAWEPRICTQSRRDGKSRGRAPALTALLKPCPSFAFLLAGQYHRLW